jgi:hypothetical protein
MFDAILGIQDEFIRYAVAAAIIFGSLYMVATSGLVPLKLAQLFAIIIGVMVVIRHYGRNT